MVSSFRRDGSDAHGIWHVLLRKNPQLDSERDFGFLLNPEKACPQLPLQINCGVIGVYRPPRADRDTLKLPPTPRQWAMRHESPWREWLLDACEPNCH